MRVLPLSEVKSKLSELVDVIERRDEEVMITRNGRAVAMIVSKDEYEGWRETAAITKDKEFMKEIRAGIRALRRTKKRYQVQQLFDD